MNNNILIFAIFWGVWILLPVVFDGLVTFIQMIVVIIWGRDFKKHRLDPTKLPLVSVIIPTYNEEENIRECLSHVKIQTYPHEKLEVIVVDNGSVDRTRDIVADHITNGHNGSSSDNTNNHGKVTIHGQTFEFSEFAGVIDLITRPEKGKPRALNEGILSSKGEIIITIDSRTFMAPDAIYNMVAKFVEKPKMIACTGNIEINWEMVYNRDSAGNLIINSDGSFQSKKLTYKEKFLAKCQFLEYLSGFRLGRQFQDIVNSMYTLAGAFSGFRRNALLTLYDDLTVSEDTDLTMALQRQKFHIGYAADAKVYLRPILSLERLYAQRVRWARGEMEVFGIHGRFYNRQHMGFGKLFFYSFLFVRDHTFVFPRLIWTFLLPFFFLFGYSYYVIWMAIVLMIGFYIFLDLAIILFCYPIVDKETRQQIGKTIHYFLIMWFYRFMIYFFRLSAYLITCKEKAEWTVSKNPIQSVKNVVNRKSLSDTEQAEMSHLPNIIRNIDALTDQQTKGADRERL